MSSSTGTVVFNDSRVRAVDVIANEKVGIGTSLPTSNLHVSGNAYVTSNLEVGTANLFVDTTTGRIGIGTSLPTSNLHLVGNAYVTSNLEVGTANLFVDTTTGRVGVGTDTPNSTLHIVSNQNSSFSLDASSIADTSYSEMRMTGPGQTNPGILSMFCNGASRTTDGGASTTTIRNNNGPIVFGHPSYVNRLRNPKDEDFVYGRWTTTLDASASTDVEKNLGSGVSTPAAIGTGMSGNIGRFTAPVAGYYYTICQVKNVTKGSSNLLIVYNAGGTNFATNNPYVGTYNEIIDLRGADNVEQAYNFAFVMHMEIGDYIQYRVHSSGYTDGTYKMDCSVHLINRI